MAHFEHEILSKTDDNEKPLMYCRYVDDIFLVARKFQHIEKLKEKLEQRTVLHFMWEIETNKKLSFLDVEVSKRSTGLSTGVRVKETDSGSCLNYRSIAPDRYKVGVVKTMLHRAYKICSDWNQLHLEITRLKKMFTNNNFPMKVIDEEIKKFIARKQQSNEESPGNTNQINFFYRNQMSSQNKQEEQNIRKIIEDHTSPKAGHTIKLSIYYKSRKLSQLFIKNNIHVDTSNSHVVYRYCCNTDMCQQSKKYIGYTTTTLKQRMTMHAQNGSILTHHKEVHKNKIKTAEILEGTDIIFRSPDKAELVLAEALLIKELKPTLNNQREGETKILSVF